MEDSILCWLVHDPGEAVFNGQTLKLGNRQDLYLCALDASARSFNQALQEPKVTVVDMW